MQEGGDSDFDSILAEMEEEVNLGGIVKELGYGCTISISQCKEALSLSLPLTENTIARILGTVSCHCEGLEDHQNTLSTFGMALGCNTSSDLPVPSSWNIDVLVDSIKQLVGFFCIVSSNMFWISKFLYLCMALLSYFLHYLQAPNTNWAKVVENLDHDGFSFPNYEAFSFFMSVYRKACQVCL